ncbi:hypothetical protein PG993_014853 [Apiospora rasikravindrae]|uniref:Swt1-like HEPN domain-containing protein n=1 Tax=Apiospora rasikravindrae TaxID=990691 RepID=A0ABR1RNX2_9PEZI
MQPTKSSLNRLPNYLFDDYSQITDDSEDGEEWNGSIESWESGPASDTPEISSDRIEDLWAVNVSQEPPVEEKPPTLAERTKLWDTDFENEASTHVEIDSAVALRLLNEAHDLVKGAFHDFCQQHQPKIWRNRFPGGPQEVLTEYPEVQGHLGLWHNDRVPGVWYLDVANAMRRVNDLRNAVCHFRPGWWVKNYDTLLRHAQRVAVAVNDKPRALRARALRDELRAVATETLEEIEQLGLASITPFRRDWKVHHEMFLQALVENTNTPRGEKEYEHRPAVMLAVDAWRWQRQSLGLDHPFLEGETATVGLV